MQNNFIDIYIPRILGDVSQTCVKSSFYNLNIGKVIDLDMRRKINENGYVYYIAFIKLELFDTPASKQMVSLLKTRGIMHFIYDEEDCQYWEIKMYIPKSMRIKEDIKKEINSIVSTAISTQIKNLENLKTYFAYDDKSVIEKEYDDMQREIYALCC